MITKIRLKRKGLKSPYVCKHIFLYPLDYHSDIFRKNKKEIKKNFLNILKSVL